MNNLYLYSVNNLNCIEKLCLICTFTAWTMWIVQVWGSDQAAGRTLFHFCLLHLNLGQGRQFGAWKQFASGCSSKSVHASWGYGVGFDLPSYLAMVAWGWSSLCKFLPPGHLHASSSGICAFGLCMNDMQFSTPSCLWLSNQKKQVQRACCPLTSWNCMLYFHCWLVPIPHTIPLLFDQLKLRCKYINDT